MFFLLIGLLASLVAKTSRAALTIGLLCWVVLCIVTPRLTTAAIESAAPTPSYAATRASIDEQIKLYNRADLHQERQDAILKRHGVANAADLPTDLRGAMMHDREQHDYSVFDRELGAFFTRLAKQDDLQGWAGLASPLLAIQAASAGLAGSDFRRHSDFLRAAESYRRALSDTMNLDLIDHPTQGGVAYLAARDVWEKVPAFVYEPAPFAQSLREVATPLSLLTIWLAAAVVAVSVAAARSEAMSTTFRRLLKLELRETLRQPLTWAVFGPLLIALFIGAATGAAHVERERATPANSGSRASGGAERNQSGRATLFDSIGSEDRVSPRPHRCVRLHELVSA